MQCRLGSLLLLATRRLVFLSPSWHVLGLPIFYNIKGNKLASLNEFYKSPKFLTYLQVGLIHGWLLELWPSSNSTGWLTERLWCIPTLRYFNCLRLFSSLCPVMSLHFSFAFISSNYHFNISLQHKTFIEDTKYLNIKS